MKLSPATRCRATLLLLLISLQAVASEPEVKMYDWLTAGKQSGSLRLEIHDDGSRIADFEFNDRGRGPKIHEKLKTGETGMLVSLEVTGHSYMGAAANEVFQLEKGLARWTSTVEKGEAEAGGFYVANEGTPEQLAVMARALLAATDRQVALLPAGRASISEVLKRNVSTGKGQQDVTLYAITGMDLTPTYLWLDPARELFALTLGWMALAPQGLAGVLPGLQEAQDQAVSGFHRELAGKLTHELPANWILKNVSVLDVEKGELVPHRLVVVENGVITRIEEDRDLNLPVYGDLQPRIVDGQGQVLMPGLWDMHTHLSLESGLLHIAAGVTTTRDLGNAPDRLKEIRASFDSGEVIGPRSFAAGFIDRKSPYSAPTGRLAENLDEALAMVRDYAAAGYPQVKIYSSIAPEWVAPIAREVHAHKMRLSGHVPSYMTTEQAVRDGFDEIQHINMLFLNFLAGPEDDTRTPLRFSLVAEKAGQIDLDSAEVTDFIELLKNKGVVVDPTVAIFDSMFRHRSGELDPTYAMVANHMPPSVMRGMMAGEMDIDETNAGAYARSADALLGMIGKLHAAGVPLVAGTDALAGFTLHRELELYRQAGISSIDVLRIATINSARVAGEADKSGSITVGKQADFVLLAGNPLKDISAVRRPVAVFRGDRWYDSAQLHEAVGIRPFTR